MNTTTLGAARERRKADRTMETNADGTCFQEGDHVRIKRTRETRRINATAGGVVYVLMNDTIESELFAGYVDKDAYYIELVTTDDNTHWVSSMIVRIGRATENAIRMLTR
jgi:hypothetical protein